MARLDWQTYTIRREISYDKPIVKYRNNRQANRFWRVTKLPEEEEEDDVEENDIEEDDFEEDTDFSSGTKIPFNINRENVNIFVRQSDEIPHFTNFINLYILFDGFGLPI